MHCDKCSTETQNPKRVKDERQNRSTYELFVQYLCERCFRST